MPGTTANYQWYLPTIGGDTSLWGGYLNANIGNQDSLIRAIENTNIGNSAPTTFQAGTQWLDNTNPVWNYAIYDGTQWVLLGTLDSENHVFIPTGALTTNVVTFTSSGTYNPSANLVRAKFQLVGGGAGGTSGGVASAPNSQPWIIGSGGGAGSYTEITLEAADIGGSQAVTIGAGGTGGAQPTGLGPNSGNNGSVTSVGTLVTANGGLGATVHLDAGSAFQSTIPGAGATATTGDFVSGGGNGNPGNIVANSLIGALGVDASGNGGASFLGGAGLGVMGNTSAIVPGNNAVANSGSGGSGGTFPGSTATGGTAGGNGAAGIVIVTEYLS